MIGERLANEQAAVQFAVMIKRLSLAALPFFLTAAAAPASHTISEADLRRHIDVLASDAFEGRQPGTAGGERTEAYLISTFADAGLKPGASDGLWRQVVPMVERSPKSATIRWTASGKVIDLPADQIVLLGRSAHARVTNAPVLFAGYGTAEELADLDLQGCALLLLQGGHPSGRAALTASELAARGAVAIITIAAATAEWPAAGKAWLERGEFTTAANNADGLISAAAASRLFDAAGMNLDQVRTGAATGNRAAPLPLRADMDVRTKVRPFETANVVGKIEGSGKAEEAIILLSHWDHLGICAPEGAADRICNGAVDNASGTAIMIEVARRLSAGPRPARTIYFLATTAEEMGLVGAHAFAAAPPVPVASIVAALNLDTTAIGPAGLPVAIIGRGEHPAIDKVVDDSARALGRKIDLDTEANVMIRRQDGWAFAARGIPTIMATGSVSDMKLLMNYLGTVYHKPDDDAAHATQLDGAVEDANLHVAITRGLADPASYPSPIAP